MHLHFRDITLDVRDNWYRAQTTWCGEEVPVLFISGDRQQIDTAIETVGPLWVDQKTWDDRFRRYAAESLLETKNDFWLEEKEPPVSEEDFISRLSLQWIQVYPGGGFEFWYADGDLFWHHDSPLTRCHCSSCYHQQLIRHTRIDHTIHGDPLQLYSQFFPQSASSLTSELPQGYPGFLVIPFLPLA